jgi:hypothetical protein
MRQNFASFSRRPNDASPDRLRNRAIGLSQCVDAPFPAKLEGFVCVPQYILAV